eukprot:503360-Hanusia_phi.AAC.1
MQLATYFCTGKLPEDSWGHYALAMDMYTHFTSPIRRYADVVVHRLLQAALDQEEERGQAGEDGGGAEGGGKGGGRTGGRRGRGTGGREGVDGEREGKGSRMAEKGLTYAMTTEEVSSICA